MTLERYHVPEKIKAFLKDYIYYKTIYLRQETLDRNVHVERRANVEDVEGKDLLGTAAAW